eukprot:scaffold9965_cov69-Cyclotella_meneghiniana.AAC.20
MITGKTATILALLRINQFSKHNNQPPGQRTKKMMQESVGGWPDKAHRRQHCNSCFNDEETSIYWAFNHITNTNNQLEEYKTCWNHGQNNSRTQKDPEELCLRSVYHESSPCCKVSSTDQIHHTTINLIVIY